MPQRVVPVPVPVEAATPGEEASPVPQRGSRERA